MSASSHTRGHRYAPEYTAVVLNWLEKNNYVADTSVCSNVSWLNTMGVNKKYGIDTKNSPNQPYYPSKNDITKVSADKNDQFKILEIPVSSFKGDYFSGRKIIGKTKLRNLLYNFGYNGVENSSFRPSVRIPNYVFEHQVVMD